MSRYKNNDRKQELSSQLAEARKQAALMERGGQYATIHHENVERLEKALEKLGKGSQKSEPDKEPDLEIKEQDDGE